MKVIKNEEVASDVFSLTILDERIATTAKPGQFVNIRVKNSYFPLLRRPLSVYSVGNETFKLLYKVVGEGTKILSTYGPDDELDIIGPIGNSFATSDYKNILIIAGGVGVAPLYFLATRVGARLPRLYNSITTLIGAKTKDEVLCEDGFAKFGKVMITTEDGSYGTKGIVTDLLVESGLKLAPTPPEVIFACGPPGMLKVVKSYARTNFIPCQISVEQHMACGMGVCLGCAVPVKSSYKYVCKDGPVFWADEIEI